MHLEAITMDRADARRAYLDYRDAIREAQHHELDEVQQRQLDQDRAIAAGYKALSVGRQLIRLSDAFTAGGFHTTGRNTGMPKLAIMRADLPRVRCTRQRSGRIDFEPADNRHHRQASKLLRIDGPPIPDFDGFSVRRIADVPPVPPALRPGPHARNYHILFEAEWRTETTPRAAGDPALLKHLRGDLYAVLAVWDLTPVEKAALDGSLVLS